jgi:hypothetical protein
LQGRRIYHTLFMTIEQTANPPPPQAWAVHPFLRTLTGDAQPEFPGRILGEFGQLPNGWGGDQHRYTLIMTV